MTIALVAQSFTNHATIDQSFCGKTLLVTLDESISFINRTHPTSLFTDLEIVSIQDLTRIDTDLRSLNINQETFRQILLLTLPVDCKENVLDVVERLRFMRGVEYAEPNYYLCVGNVPNDPYFLNGQMWGLEKIEAVDAWIVSTGSHTIKVGVIDTGIASHPDLDANLTTGWDFVNETDDTHDTNGHGTYIAGTIGAVGNNGIGVVGVNWNVTLVPIKIHTTGSSISQSAAIRGITWATEQSIPILNFSIAGFQTTTTIRNAVRNYPGLFIWGAGNSGQNLDTFIAQHGSFDLPNLISVGATDVDDERSIWSNRSSDYGIRAVNIFAPGSNIRTTHRNGEYISQNGTSMAAPHVSGTAALLLSMNPSLTAAQKKIVILNSADQITISTPIGHQDVLRLNVGNLAIGLSMPYNLTHTVSGQSVVLNWRAPLYPSSPVLGYRVYLFDTLLTTLSNTATTFVVENVPTGEFTYKVTAVYTDWETKAIQTTVYMGFNPPTNLTAVAGADIVYLSWERPEIWSPTTVVFQGYLLEMRRVGEHWSLLSDSLTPSQTTFNVGLATYHGITYEFRARSRFTNPERLSNFSNIAVLETPMGRPIFDAQPTSWNFQPAIIDWSLHRAFFIIRNLGGDGLVINSITITGDNADDFSIHDNAGGTLNLPITLSANNGTGFSVDFMTSTLGDLSASIVIEYNLDDSPKIIPLTARGIMPTHLWVRPPSIDFGRVAIGQSSSEQEVRVTNVSGTELDVYLTLIESSNTEGSFSIVGMDNMSSLTLEADEEIVLNVIFTPFRSAIAIAGLAIGHSHPGLITAIVSLTGRVLIDTDIDDTVDVPLVTALLGNFPNPFNPSTTIRFEVQGSRFVKIEVYDIRGRLVRILLDGSKGFEAGRHSVVWDGRDDNGVQVGSGVYLYRMRAGGYEAVRRMVLMK